MSDRDDRVDELESKVERLEATIQGLTEELVEVHDRLETLEDADAPTQSPTRAADRRRSPESESGASAARTDENDGDKSQESQNEDETGGDSELGDDIIVA
jgi:peptidoglycan hydrolase CwlO-like protein